MKNKFEDDELLSKLSKAAGEPKGPKLNEAIIYSAVNSDLKFAQRKFATPRLLVSLAGGAAALSITAILVTSQVPMIELANHDGKSGIEFLSTADSREGSIPTGDTNWDIFIPVIKAKQSGLSEETGQGMVYKARNTQNQDELLNKLASYFGVEGEPVERDGFKEILGDTLGKRGRVYVSAKGSLSFSYINDTSESETPVVEISKESALKIFSDFGLKVGLDDIHLKFNRAVAYVPMNNQESPLAWSLTWRADKRIYALTGSAVEFNPASEVETVSPSKSFSRLNILSREPGHVVVLHEDRVDTASPRNLIESCRPFDTEFCEVKVTRSEPSLGYVYDQNGQLWLVPSHSFYVGGILAGGASALPGDFVPTFNLLTKE